MDPATPAVDRGLWLRRFHAADDAPIRLVCSPHAGGSASYFFPLSKALAPGVDVRAVQYPGRQDRHREPFLDTVDAMADHAYVALEPLLDRPVALFGHSMGATVAFEVARRIEDRGGVVPATVFVSGSRAPSRHRAEAGSLTDADDDLVEVMRSLGGTDRRFLDDPELRSLVLPAFRNDFRAVARYRRETDAQIGAPVVVLTGTSDPRTSIEDAEAWREHTRGRFQMHTFDGGHFFLEAQAEHVVKLIMKTLETHLTR